MISLIEMIAYLTGVLLCALRPPLLQPPKTMHKSYDNCRHNCRPSTPPIFLPTCNGSFWQRFLPSVKRSDHRNMTDEPTTTGTTSTYGGIMYSQCHTVIIMTHFFLRRACIETLLKPFYVLHGLESKPNTHA